MATPILSTAPANASSSPAPAVPVGALEIPPPSEPLITLTLGGGNSGGIEIDLTLPNPATPAPVTPGPAAGTAATSSVASTSANTADSSATANAPTASVAPEIVVNLSALAPESEITIGLSQSATGGEQFSLGIGTQANPSQEQINISLAQNSNEQIVLNLLNAGSGGSASSAPGSLINISI